MESITYRMAELEKKNATEGLTVEEIAEYKRLFLELAAKLSYYGEVTIDYN